jgi:LytS/YehU family sensor histidine kinase
VNAKKVAFIAIMSAMGTILSGLSLNIAPLLSAAGAGGAALDLSHIATFIAAFLGGPYAGAIVGFMSGIYAGYYFGYVLGTLGLLSLIGLPLGKAMTGLLAGFLYKKLNTNESHPSSVWAVPLTLLSYVPEALYTAIYFVYIVLWTYGRSMSFMIPIVIPKAWIEILVMSIIMSILTSRSSFREFTRTFIPLRLKSEEEKAKVY